jgi:hypothetical protein
VLKRFLPNPENRRLFPGFVAFCVAAVGAALGFWAHYMEWEQLGELAFLVTALGVIGGFIAIVVAVFRTLKS